MQRYGGDSGVRTLSCAEQFRAIAFAQLTWRESLRDIEASLSVNASKLPALYRSRRQVDLFFKSIKQHQRIKKLLGTSENAVKTQVWRAVATCVLIAIVKKVLQLNASPYTCLQILSVSVFEKTQLASALQLDDSGIEASTDTNP